MTPDPHLTEEWWAGYNAHLDDDSYASNPYPEGSDQEAAWQNRFWASYRKENP